MTGRPLGRTSRATLVLLALAQHRRQPAPTISELRRGLRLEHEPRFATVDRLDGLRQLRLLRFTDDPRSLRVTPRGLDAALGRRSPDPRRKDPA